MASYIMSIQDISFISEDRRKDSREEAKASLRDYINSKLQEAATYSHCTSVYIEDFFSVLTLDLSLEVIKEIEQKGYNVYFTLSKDEKILSIAGQGVLICWNHNDCHFCKFEREG